MVTFITSKEFPKEITLPVDIALKFFGYLTYYELCVAARVCRIFKALSENDQLWKFLYTQDFPDSLITKNKNFKQLYKGLFLNLKNGQFCASQVLPADVKKTWRWFQGACFLFNIRKDLLFCRGRVFKKDANGYFQIHQYLDSENQFWPSSRRDCFISLAQNGCVNGVLTAWKLNRQDVFESTTLFQCQTPNENVYAVGLNENYLCVEFDDFFIRIWKQEDTEFKFFKLLKYPHSLKKGHRNFFYEHIFFSGHQLVKENRFDQGIQILSVQNENIELIQRLSPISEIRDLALRGDCLFTLDQENKLSLRKLENRPDQGVFQTLNNARTHCFCLSLNNQYLFTSYGNEIKVWKRDSQNLFKLHTIFTLNDDAMIIELDFLGTCLTVCYQNKHVEMLDFYPSDSSSESKVTP